MATGKELVVGPLAHRGGKQWLFTDNFARSDGVIGSIWNGATYSIASGALRNTPTLGSDALVNGNMETGSPPTGWTADSGATITQVVDNRPGSAGTHALDVVLGTDRVVAHKTTGSGQLGWYRNDGWLNQTTGTESYIATTATPMESLHYTPGVWQNPITAFRVPTSQAIILRLYIIGTAGNSGRFDDMSIKPITPSSLFATVSKNIADVNMIAPPVSSYLLGTQHGIVLRCDNPANPQNFVIAYLNGHPTSPRVIVEKCVGGVYTILATVTLAYSLTKHFSAQVVGNSAYIYYGTDSFGTLINGAAFSIDAALAGNTYHGLMSTYEGNTFSGTFRLGRYKNTGALNV